MKLDRLKMHQEWFDRNQHLMFLESRIVMQELLAMTREARNQRDEARKMCCELEARIIVLEEDRRDTSNKFGTNPCSEIILADSPLARYPKEIAKRKGWDCFK